MPQKLLKKIAFEYAGIGSDKIVDLLFNKKNVNEFMIAKKLNLTINQTRNILYKLADEGLVSFIRKKDKKKGGWYTYFWTLDSEKSLSKYKENLNVQKNQLIEQLATRETKQFYFCKNCNIEYSEEEALLNNYTCSECGEVLNMRSSGELVNSIKLQLKGIEQILEQIELHLKDIYSKQAKTRVKRDKAEQKKKQEEREKRKKERAKNKKKESLKNKSASKKTKKIKKAKPKKSKPQKKSTKKKSRK